MSDQCAHTTKVAVFSDEACTVFRDSKEFEGSIFEQFENTVNYLALCNKTESEIKGVIRTDKHDYPEEAIREALLNALIHRDYSFSGSIIINVTDQRMEFISLGGLLPGLSLDDIQSGISQPRNKRLADVFHRLRLVESYGTGIRRIYKLYADCPLQPKIEVTSHTFKIILPNMNNTSDNKSEKVHGLEVTSQMQQILSYIKENGQIKENEISSMLNIKKTRTYTIAKEMRDLNLIQVIGRGDSKYYIIK